MRVVAVGLKDFLEGRGKDDSDARDFDPSAGIMRGIA